MQTIEDVKAASLIALRDFYNAKSPKRRIKGFMNRVVAERRVLALIEWLRIQEELRLNPPPPPQPRIAVYRTRVFRKVVPDDEATLPDLDKPEAEITEAEALAELQLRKQAKRIHAQALSAAVAKTWQDPDIAAKRKLRHAVIVTEGETSNHYTSTHAAFLALGLPSTKCIAFRKRLKHLGKMIFRWGEKDYLFELRHK